MGETQNRPFQLSFNCSLKVDFQAARTSRLWRTLLRQSIYSLLAGYKDVNDASLARIRLFGSSVRVGTGSVGQR